MPSMIDRYLLRYFLAVVDTGSFSKGAVQVNVTQPTLSVGIAKLEKLCGTTLFHRSSQRVHLTEAGSRLVAHARRIENDFNLAIQSVAGASSSQVIRLGILSTIPTDMLERIAAEHRRRDDQGQIEIVEGNERDLVMRLGRGRIDLAVTVLRPHTTWPSEPLFREGYSLAMPRWHRFAGADAVRPQDLAEEAMIIRRHCEALSETSRYFVEHGVRPRFSFRTTNDDKALAMVRAGLGITVMPDCYRDPEISRPRLAGLELAREIGLVSFDTAGADAMVPLIEAIRVVMA